MKDCLTKANAEEKMRSHRREERKPETNYLTNKKGRKDRKKE